jgi:hypothetical protein
MAMFQAELFANNASETIATNGYAGSATADTPAALTQESWTFTAVTEWPAASSSASPTTGFRIANSNSAYPEIMAVINISGDVATVLRGIEGTTTYAHPAGSTFYAIASAGTLDQFGQNELQAVTTPVTASNTASTETIVTWTPAAQDVPAAGVAYEFTAFGTLSTAATAADVNVEFTVAWNGTTLATLTTGATAGGGGVSVGTDITDSGWWLEGAIICESATSMVAGMNFVTHKTSTASYQGVTVSNDGTDELTAGAVTVSGDGPLTVTAAWLHAETANVLAGVGYARRVA